MASRVGQPCGITGSSSASSVSNPSILIIKLLTVFRISIKTCPMLPYSFTAERQDQGNDKASGASDIGRPRLSEEQIRPAGNAVGCLREHWNRDQHGVVARDPRQSGVRQPRAVWRGQVRRLRWGRRRDPLQDSREGYQGTGRLLRIGNCLWDRYLLIYTYKLFSHYPYKV